MTQDNDPGHFCTTPPRKSYNPFDSDDETSDSTDLKSQNVYTKEDCIGIDLNTLEESVDALTFDMNKDDFSWEEAILGQRAVNASANGHTGLFGKDGQLYTDKNVTEYVVPEFIICCKERTFQSVKDIGIDEGVPTLDTTWVRSSEDESKDTSAFLALSSESNDAFNMQKDSGELDVLEALKSRLGGDWQMDAPLYRSEDTGVGGLSQEVQSGECLGHESRDDDSLKITELKLDFEAQESFPVNRATKALETAPVGLTYDATDSQPAVGTDANKDASKQGEPDFMDEDGAGSGHDGTVKKGNSISLDKVDDVVVQEPTIGETLPVLSTDSGEVKAKPDESATEEETFPGCSVHVAMQEPACTSDSNKMTYNSNLDSGGIILDFNSSTDSDSRKREDNPQNLEAGRPPTTQTMTRHEESRAHGETSLSSSVPVPPPSSITFAGPVSYSGSISLRSESSAGSTRSFAFPTLQTEWNSSPVRMAKADHRQFRKHRGWVQAIICCRF